MFRSVGAILLVAMLACVLCAAQSGAGWTLRVHRGDQIHEYDLATVDSLTFVPADPGIPPTVPVPAGTFIQGDGVAWCGQDEREVTLTRSFEIAQHEVTNAEYVTALQWAFDHGFVAVNDTAVLDNLDGSAVELVALDSPDCEIAFDGNGLFLVREAPSEYASNAYPEGYDAASHPMKMVTWFGAARYCDWLSLYRGWPRAYEHTGDWACNGNDPYAAPGYRLPTDAEWEYAARYPDDRIYAWGGEDPACERANYWGFLNYCVGWTTPVGFLPDGFSALGCADVSGNCQEWCNDWKVCDLGTDPVLDPIGPVTGTARVLHGGSWNHQQLDLRCASRASIHTPDYTNYAVGFRFARTIPTF